MTLGLDPHPGSHTVAALEANGSSLANLTVLNTPAGLAQLHPFAAPFPSRRWAIEGAGHHFTTTFVGQRLGSGGNCSLDSPSLTNQYRARRGRKKNDAIAAENVARALLANPQWPALQLLDQQREWQELTRAQRRFSEPLKASRSTLQELTTQSPVREILRQLIRTLVSHLRKRKEHIQQLVNKLISPSEFSRRSNARKEHIQQLVNKLMPSLLEVPGVGPIVAGVL